MAFEVATVSAASMMAREATLVEEVDCSSTKVQRPLESVETWVAAASSADGVFFRAGGVLIRTASSAEEAAATAGMKIDTLVPELFQLRQ